MFFSNMGFFGLRTIFSALVINFVAINDAYYTAAAFYGKVGTTNRK